MAVYRILYWQELPAQIKAEDDDGEVSIEMPPRFTALIDRAAMERGLAGNDAYLEQWNWSDEMERSGTAAEVADSVRNELEAKFP